MSNGPMLASTTGGESDVGCRGRGRRENRQNSRAAHCRMSSFSTAASSGKPINSSLTSFHLQSKENRKKLSFLSFFPSPLLALALLLPDSSSCSSSSSSLRCLSSSGRCADSQLLPFCFYSEERQGEAEAVCRHLF